MEKEASAVKHFVHGCSWFGVVDLDCGEGLYQSGHGFSSKRMEPLKRSARPLLQPLFVADVNGKFRTEMDWQMNKCSNGACVMDVLNSMRRV